MIHTYRLIIVRSRLSIFYACNLDYTVQIQTHFSSSACNTYILLAYLKGKTIKQSVFQVLPSKPRYTFLRLYRVSDHDKSNFGKVHSVIVRYIEPCSTSVSESKIFLSIACIYSSASTSVQTFHKPL